MLADRRLKANWALSRRYYGDGHWGSDPKKVVVDGFVIEKYRPRSLRWEKSSVPQRVQKVHAVRYRLTAREQEGGPVIRQVTVWHCGQHSRSDTVPRQVLDPIEVCAACWGKAQGVPTTLKIR